MPIELVLGGARSGKSRFAENRVHELTTPEKSMHYVATSEALDDEMVSRIEHHQAQRGEGWKEWECPTSLALQLLRFDEDDVVLIDCLTLWLNNVIYYQGKACSNQSLQEEIEALAFALQQCSAHVILVSNEVGMGVVPMGEVTRLFVDNAGRMNQIIAAVSQRVVFVAAGLPLVLKSGAD
ncbi:bifunctional adenosylcobinamide kinase/adenosylcobinamide-phosphate guanylyltransferase [Vibrio sp. 10N.261.51.F12]|uniref:bifunctional adenosylcobinamide kinase/adenosylcobinamide-phosphate guanylyltransferase n=1 Tax=Vibrio sp. 10N.261.51.F12 TaxID=3229679 RepID=UPI00354E4C5B